MPNVPVVRLPRGVSGEDLRENTGRHKWHGVNAPQVPRGPGRPKKHPRPDPLDDPQMGPEPPSTE